MKGLIWAGIGKGIADAGQIFGNAMMRDYEMQRKEALDLLREERADKRAEERDVRQDELKAARARTTEEELQQRVIRESAQAGTRAGEIATTREGKAFDKLAESSAMAGEQGDVALSKEQLQKLAKEEPAIGKQYRNMGLIEASMPLTARERRLQRAEDEMQASLDIGAHSTVQNAMLKKRESVLNEIREANKEDERKAEREATNRRLDQSDLKFQQLVQYQDRMAGAAETRADAAVTSAGAAVARAEATARKAREIGGMSDARLNQEAETLRKAAKDASTSERRQEYEDRLAEVLRAMAARRTAATAPAASSSTPAASAPAAPAPAPAAAPARVPLAAPAPARVPAPARATAPVAAPAPTSAPAPRPAPAPASVAATTPAAERPFVRAQPEAAKGTAADLGLTRPAELDAYEPRDFSNKASVQKALSTKQAKELFEDYKYYASALKTGTVPRGGSLREGAKLNSEDLDYFAQQLTKIAYKLEDDHGIKLPTYWDHANTFLGDFSRGSAAPTAAPPPARAPAAAGPSNSRPTTTISTLPRGAVKIGTSGGKPVYETPDGKRFIGQ